MGTQTESRYHASALAGRFAAVRALSEALAAPLGEADACVQSMEDASPAKWHLAHTTWFFESFVLRDHVPGYRLYRDSWPFLFNSYYEAEGPRHARPRRGLLTRPTLAEVIRWRHHVDAAIADALPQLPAAARVLLELGCHHEQQHQELLLMDIQHLLAQNPLAPALWPSRPARVVSPPPLEWVEGAVGETAIGADGDDGFAFDCEGPRHTAWLSPHALASRCVTNGEWAEFIADGGYRNPALWLSDGWAWVQREAVEAPGYWRRDGNGGWIAFGLDGLGVPSPHAPVCHVSLFEADAFARWAGARLPTEFEWEAAAVTHDADGGNQLDRAGAVHPRPAASPGMAQLFGDVWEWTGSAYRPYPGFREAEGAVGEYNGKFMNGQFVLRGGCCATPRGHVRASYRNFFYPHQRWQFAGVRLARDL